eukprot:g575.t1
MSSLAFQDAMRRLSELDGNSRRLPNHHSHIHGRTSCLSSIPKTSNDSRWHRIRRAGKNAASLDYSLWAVEDKFPVPPREREEKRFEREATLWMKDRTQQRQKQKVRGKAALKKMRQEKYKPVYGEFGHSTRGGLISLGEIKSELDFSIQKARTEPGPAYYTLPDTFNMSRGGKFSSAVPKSDLDYRIREAKQSPAPCDYNTSISALKQTGALSFAEGKPKTHLERRLEEARNSPGPGEYNISYNYAKNISGGQWKSPAQFSQKERELRKAARLPGPSYYNPDNFRHKRVKSSRWREDSKVVKKSKTELYVLSSKDEDIKKKCRYDVKKLRKLQKMKRLANQKRREDFSETIRFHCCCEMLHTVFNLNESDAEKNCPQCMGKTRDPNIQDESGYAWKGLSPRIENKDGSFDYSY